MKNNQLFRGIVLHQVFITAVAGVIAYIGFVNDSPPNVYLTSLFTGAIIIQGMRSTHLKSLGRANEAIFVDAGLMIILAAVAGAAKLVGESSIAPLIMLVVSLYVLALTVSYASCHLRGGSVGVIANWRRAISQGLVLMIGGLVSVIITASGRLMMGIIATPQMAGEYAILSRASALPIVAHQLIVAARFRSIYKDRQVQAARVFMQVIGLVGVVGLVLVTAVPSVGYYLGNAFYRVALSNPFASSLLIAQSVLWSAIILNDMLCARNGIVGRIIFHGLGVVLLGFGLVLVAVHYVGLSLSIFVCCQSAIMLAYFGVQCVLMSRSNLPVRRFFVLTVSVFSLLVAVANILWP
jgi:hypothetical protein